MQPFMKAQKEHRVEPHRVGEPAPESVRRVAGRDRSKAVLLSDRLAPCATGRRPTAQGFLAQDENHTR